MPLPRMCLQFQQKVLKWYFLLTLCSDFWQWPHPVTVESTMQISWGSGWFHFGWSQWYFAIQRVSRSHLLQGPSRVTKNQYSYSKSKGTLAHTWRCYSIPLVVELLEGENVIHIFPKAPSKIAHKKNNHETAMKDGAKEWLLFMRTILFAVTWAFWKMYNWKAFKGGGQVLCFSEWPYLLNPLDNPEKSDEDWTDLFRCSWSFSSASAISSCRHRDDRNK